MNSQTLSKLYLTLAMSGVFVNDMYYDYDGQKHSGHQHLDIDELRKRVKELKNKQLIQKGCKEYFYRFENITIIALNQKNADRKYKRYLELKKESENEN